jgi:hypothetical protein
MLGHTLRTAWVENHGLSPKFIQKLKKFKIVKIEKLKKSVGSGFESGQRFFKFF